MSNNSDTLNVKILEKEYMVACPQSEQDALQRSAKYLDNKMREVRASGKVHGLERIAVMVALNVTHDYLQGGELNSDAQSTAARLAESVDLALKELI